MFEDANKFNLNKNKARGKENKADRLCVRMAVRISSPESFNLVDKRMQVNLQEFEHLSEKAVDLIFNNKINAKNAFDVNVEYLEKLPHLLNRNEETSWQKASASLDASAKIYGYRVDSVHSETFKFLGGLSRAEAKEDEAADENDKKEKRNRDGKHNGFSTLEKDPKRLDLVKYDLEFEVDPLFRSMTAKFGDSGARGLLLKTLPLDNNLDVLLESKEKNEILSVKINEVSSDIKSILDNALSQFSIAELRSVQICPDLSYFKKARDLESSLEKTFYQNLMHEFDDTMFKDNLMREESNLNADSLDNSINIGDQMENENMDMSSLSQRSSYDSNISARFDENINTNMINISSDIQKMMGVSYLEGFSYLRSDEIKEYIHQFGDGNKEIFKNVPQYTNFTKSFNQLEKFNNILNTGNIANNKKEKKPKKEEKLFEFDEKNEVKRNEVFEKESKVKKVVSKEVNRKKYRKKVKQYYHYDRSVLFNLFSIQDRLIQDKIDGFNNDAVEDNQTENREDFSIAEDDAIPRMDEQKNNFAETFVKIGSEYEKKFGRLYKTFDVRLIKTKIWESISFLKNPINYNTLQNNLDSGKTVDFKQIIDSVSTNLPKEVISNISTPTCFVCLLHLSNEKNLILEELDENNFTIRTEEIKQE